MRQVIGDILPLALGVAISPIPIIATILMLLAPKAGGTSAGFLLGWVIGIAAAATVFTVIAATAGLSGASEPSSAASWFKIVLGALLLLLAGRQWRGRPAPGEDSRLAEVDVGDRLVHARASGRSRLRPGRDQPEEP